MTSTIRRLAALAAGYAVADGLLRGMGFVLLPLLVIYLSPAEYGVIGALTALASLLTQLFGFGLAGVAIRFFHALESELERRRFLGSTLLASAVLAALGTGVAQLISIPLLSALGLSPLLVPVTLTLWTAWLQVVGRTIPLGILRARDAVVPYLIISAVTVSATLAMVVLRVAVWQQGVTGVLRGLLEGSAVSALAAIMLVARDLRWSLAPNHVRTAFGYGLPLTAHHVTQWALALSDRFMIGHFLGATALGYYHFAYQFASIFQLVISSANGALLPRFARLGLSPTEGNLTQLRHTLVATIAGCGAIGIVLAVLIPPLVAVFASEYLTSTPYLPWLVLAVGSGLAYSIPLNLLTMTVGQTSRIWSVTVLAGVSNVLLNAFLLPRIGLRGAVFATAAAYAVLYIGVKMKAQSATNLLGRLRLGGPQLRIAAVGLTAVLASLVAPHSLAVGTAVSIASLAAIALLLQRMLHE